MSDALNLTVLRRLVRKGLGDLDEDDINDEDVDLLLNLSLWNISDKYWHKEKECLVMTNTEIGRAEYQVPNILDAIHSISFIDPDTKESRKVIRMDWDRYEQLRNEKGAGAEGEEKHRAAPERYVRFRDIIYFHPIPDKVYQIRLAFWRTIASLVEGTVDTTNLPRNWQEIVVEGAITRGHYYHEDYSAAQQADNFRVGHERSAALAKDKEERDNKFARLRVIDEFPDEVDSGTFLE